MITLLKRLLDKEMRPAMTKQITTLEKTFTWKMETQLTQRMLADVNSETDQMDRVYDRLQLKNRWLQS